FITCIEVIEHTTDPVATLKDMASFLRPGGVILVGTTVQPTDIDIQRGRWWYIGPRNGHISIFSLSAMAEAARRAGLAFWVGAYGNFLFTRENEEQESAALRNHAGGGVARRFMGLRCQAPGAVPSPDAAVQPASESWHGLEELGPNARFR